MKTKLEFKVTEVEAALRTFRCVGFKGKRKFVYQKVFDLSGWTIEEPAELVMCYDPDLLAMLEESYTNSINEQ